mgnify:CR=1 FL=1
MVCYNSSIMIFPEPKNKITIFFNFLKSKISIFYSKKKIFWPSVVIAVILVLVIAQNNGSSNQIQLVSAGDYKKTVEATGEITSDIDLTLPFKKSGTVKEIKVAVGDLVVSGEILATLEAGNENAEVMQARGALLKAQAEYNNAIDVTQNQEIAKAELELENAIKEQETLVENAYRNLLSDGLEAVADDGDQDVSAPTISGSYLCEEEGSYTLELYSSGTTSGASFEVHGLEEGFTGSVKTDAAVPIGECGLTIIFPTGFYSGIDWVIEIPNKNSSEYASNLNTYNLALSTQQKVISELEADLEIKKTQVSTGDTKIAYANLVSAQGVYAAATALLEETIIRAPAAGKVTKIDANIGERVEAFDPIVVIQDVDNLYIEANINESNILNIKNDQKVEITFDSSPNEIFIGSVINIDIAPTIVSGVVNYNITISLENADDRIRPGMTANIKVIVADKVGIIAIPLRSISNSNEGDFIKVSKYPGGEKSEERKVSLGEYLDGTLVEIVSGLEAGEYIVTPELK